MDGLNRFNALLFQTAEQAVILFMGIIALVIPYEVFGRYVLGDMPMWSGEAATYSLVWVSMLGGAVGLRKGVQVGHDHAIGARESVVGEHRWQCHRQTGGRHDQRFADRPGDFF